MYKTEVDAQKKKGTKDYTFVMNNSYHTESKKKYDIDENTTKKVSIKLSNQITIGELKSLLLSEVTESEFFFF
jgi:hypothetical protein